MHVCRFAPNGKRLFSIDFCEFRSFASNSCAMPSSCPNLRNSKVTKARHVSSLLLLSFILFYMFQSMGYAVDVYRGTVTAEQNLFRLALFSSYFPQLIQGPISQFSKLAPQLYAPRKWNGKEVSFGLQRLLWGFFKKMVVADRIAVAVQALRGEEYQGFAFFLLMIFFAILRLRNSLINTLMFFHKRLRSKPATGSPLIS